MNVCKCGSLGREKIIIVSNNYSPFSFPAHREEKKERMKERGNLVARGGEPFKSRAIQMESVSLNISHRRRLHQSGYVVLFTGSRQGAAFPTIFPRFSLPFFQGSSNNQHNQARVAQYPFNGRIAESSKHVNYNRER